MFIKLVWQNDNHVPVTYKIYRDNTPLDRTKLGTALATIDGSTPTYTDLTVTAGNTYYYVVETISASGRNVSRNYQMVAEYKRGVGLNAIIDGDERLGYLGPVDVVDWITPQKLYTLLGLTSAASTTVPIMMKFVRNGKIILVPRATYGTITHKELIDKKLHKGGDDVSPLTIVVNGYTYRVRLPTGVSDTWDGGTTTAVPVGPNEFSDLFLPTIKAWVDVNQKLKKVFNNSATLTVLTAEFNATKLSTRSPSPTTPSVGSDGVSWVTYTPAAAPSAAFFPIFELVQ